VVFGEFKLSKRMKQSLKEQSSSGPIQPFEGIDQQLKETFFGGQVHTRTTQRARHGRF
jgi:hypothetical protein